MVVQRSDEKDPLATNLKRKYLQNYRQGLSNEDSTDKNQENLLFADQSNQSQRAAQRKRWD